MKSIILDNLLIIINSEKNYEDYASQLLEISGQLTKVVKTQVFEDASYVDGIKTLENFGVYVHSMAEGFAE